MVSLPLESHFLDAKLESRGSIAHRRFNLAYLATLLNGGRDVFAPGFLGPQQSAQRLRQLSGTILQLLKLPFADSAVEISGRLSDYGPISITIRRAGYGSVVSQLRAGQPSIVVQREKGTPDPLQNLCDYLGVDTIPAVNGRILDNPILVFECVVQGQPVFVHLGVGQPGLKAVERHRNGLRRLADVALSPDVRAITASIVETRCPRASVLVQSKVPGHALPLRQMEQSRVLKHIERTLDLVLSLSSVNRKIPNGPDDSYIRDKLSTLGARISPQFARDVMPAVDAVTRWPDRENIPAAFVHGDLWLSNVLFNEGGVPVGLVDWEWSRQDGLPAFDALQLVCGSLAFHRKLPIATVLAQVWDPSVREPWVAAMLERIRERLHLDQDALVRTALVLWLGIIRRSAVETDGTSPDWFAKNVAAPALSLKNSAVFAN